MSKINRQQVYEKCNGHCAYCGKEITMKQMQVDHIKPIWRGYTDNQLHRMEVIRGTEDIENLNPACRSCNNAKGSESLERFRQFVERRIEILDSYSTHYRMAKDYGLITETNKTVTFYFEKI